MDYKGLFVTFEGPDCSGKSTVLERLKIELNRYFSKDENQIFNLINKEIPPKFFFINEPGGSDIGEKIRELLLFNKNKMKSMTEAYLFAASRAELFHGKGLDYLKNGDVIICDRYLDSSIAYQGAGRELGEDLVSKLNALGATNNLEPQKIFFFNLKPDLVLERIKMHRNDPDRFEQLDIDFHKRVYDSYTKRMKKLKKQVITIDANNSKEKVYDDVFQELTKIIKDHYKSKKHHK